jgi:hypothetical protein
MNTETLTDGELFDQFLDMMTPDEIVRMLDRGCFQEALAGVYAILKARADTEPKFAEAATRQLMKKRMEQ